MGQPEQAAAALDKAAAINPDDLAAWFFKAACLNAMRQYEQALLCCERVLLKAPEHGPTWELKGSALLALNRLPEAKTALEKAVELGDAGARLALIAMGWLQPDDGQTSADDAAVTDFFEGWDEEEMYGEEIDIDALLEAVRSEQEEPAKENQ
jgi:tetratricopeptide (TPR) repeat protein